MTSNGNGNGRAVASFFERNSQNILMLCGALITGTAAFTHLESRVATVEASNISREEFVIVRDRVKANENRLQSVVAQSEVDVLKVEMKDTLKEIDTIYEYSMNDIYERQKIRDMIARVAERVAALETRK